MNAILLSQLVKGFAVPENDCYINNVTSDSREVIENSVFLAIRGERVNGENYAAGAIEKGAKFVVTPGFNPEMIAYIKSTGIPMMPGAATPGEMEQAMSMGLTNIKFFPAEANGGVNKLKALAGPYQAAKWMPTGGVNTKNLNDYLSFDRILCCGGTWIATSADINEGKWDDITRKCKDAIKTMLGVNPKVHLVAPKSITRSEGKAVRVVDKRKLHD